MAKALSALPHTMRLHIVTDTDGVPQSAYVDYRVEDGLAVKVGRLQLAEPDFAKVMHDAGTAGEFWTDMVTAINAAEGIV